ncbi:MAG: OmpA family protein [Bacteroidota bacterium]
MKWIKKISIIFSCTFFANLAISQDIQWATAVNYDNEISNKDGYNARKIAGQPDAETYGKYVKNAATVNPNKNSFLWLDFVMPIETKQILILESNGAGFVSKVELVDAVSGTTLTVYEQPTTDIAANYRLFRIVLPDKSKKAKQIKIKFSTTKEQQQIDAVAISSSDEEFTLKDILNKYAKSKVTFNEAGNDPSLNNATAVFNSATVNVLNIKKDSEHVGEPLKKGESGNLGRDVNTSYDEIAPIISPDEQTLFFIRSSYPKNTFGWKENSEDIWYSEYDKQKELWGEAKHLGLPFNKTDFNKIVGITPDGNTALIKGLYKKGEYKERGFSFSHKIMKGWSEPEQIKLKGFDNMAKGNHQGSFFSNDGKTILLSFSEKEGSDNNDLYVTFLEEDDKWSRPKSLGTIINTEDNDDTPFLASDGVSLYFSSDRIGGLGKRDIYLTKRLDNTWLNWTVPVNIGPTVNTSGDDANYSIAASGYYAYMVSSRNSLGGTDIVRIKLKDEIKPNPVVLISGQVFNAKNNQPLDASISYQLLAEGTEQGIARTNPENGNYKIVLPYGTRYSFLAKAEGFLAVSDNIDLSTIQEYKEITRDLYLVPIEIGETVRLNNIFFDLSKATLRDESFPELNRLAKYMLDNPVMEIEMSGHTDNVGSDQSNNQLSQDRSNAVKTFLVSKGIADSRIVSKGYGKSKPITTNEKEEGRQLNRRVEFTILKK